MALWLKLLLSVLLPAAILVAVVFFVYRRRSLPRNAPPELPKTAADGAAVGGGGGGATASPGLGKLNIRYNATSGRAGVRFQQLHHHHYHQHGHIDVKHRVPSGGSQKGPFQWGDHPRLVTEAAENGWAQFVFAVAPPRASSASSSPLWGLCPACDSGTSRDVGDAAWEVPAGSSERMQAVRLDPTAAAAAAASSKKWLPGSIPSPLRGDQDAGNSNALCLARMTLPLPGPPLAGSPFPQDAYFEITIIYLNTRRPEWSASRASRRGRDGPSESDRVKLMSSAPNSKNATQETRADKDDDHQDKQRHLVMSLGLAAASAAAPARPSLSGTYASSIGFHSNGTVYLDGMKLVYESEKSSWAGVDKVVGCGFEPAKRKVFFTVDGQLVHAVSCNADAFSTPLYPVLTSSFDVMALVNLGQSKFRYAPTNSRRTANPCFVRAGSVGDDGRSGGSMGLDFDDSGELFSMGRVDSGWMEASRMSKSRKENGGGGASAGDLDGGESDLFEISLRD